VQSSWQKILPQEFLTDILIPSTISLVSMWRMVYSNYFFEEKRNDADRFNKNVNKETYENHDMKFLGKW
jgi:hypothetical protein